VRLLRSFGAVVILVCVTLAQETSPHDPAFERWLRDTFFDGYKPAGYNPRWDIAAAANREHGGIPVSVKTARLGAAIELGDALRQYEIDEPFLLVVGFWTPDSPTKRIVNIVAPVVSAEQWRKLWGPVTYADLQRLDALIKDTGPTVEEIRRRALLIRSSPPFSGAIIQVNPKIDDHGTRRLQCSLRSADVFARLAPGSDPNPQERPALFGTEYPAANNSKARSANQE
jgi:hypothetical protein